MKSKKDKSSKRKNISKGASRGFVVSLLFHVAAFFIAGLFVVFTVVTKTEPEFVAPAPVERPKMNLKKPKVKVKKSSQPKPSSRIVAKVKSRDMPEILLPDLMGSGDGILGGMGVGDVFMDLPEIGDLSLFGTTQSAGNDLVGTFYDFKRRSSGGPFGVSDPEADMPNLFRDFLDSGWNKSVFAKYYHSPRKLYSSTIVIPETPSVVGPMAFGEETAGYFWGVLYEGTLVSYKDIRFRFWGMGDNYIFAGVDGETVLAYWLNAQGNSYDSSVLSEYTTRTEFGTPLTYGYGFDGKWIDLKAGEPKKLQVLIGESGGGASSFMLCVEVDGVEYPFNPYMGGITLPVFQTAVQSQTQVEELERVIYPGDATVNEGPVFQDFDPETSKKNPSTSASVAAADPDDGGEKDPARHWVLSDGNEFDGSLLNLTSDTVWIKTADGKEVKVSRTRLSDEDRLYLELYSVPEMRIDFTEKTTQVQLPPIPGDNGDFPAKIMDYSFKVRVKLMDKLKYHYPLTVEYFAIGSELEGDNYVLWQRGQQTFVPSKENGCELEFSTDSLRRITSAMQVGNRMRGEKYDGYIVTVTDQRGEIIAHRESHKFLFTYLDRLKNLPITRHFDNTCSRVAPPRPVDGDRQWAVNGVFNRAEE